MKKYHSPKEYLDAASSECTSQEELDEIAKSDYSFVKEAVAKNKNTQPNTLRYLIPAKIDTFIEQEIALAISENPNISQDILEVLIERIENVVDNGREHQIGFLAGIKICSNPNIPLSKVVNLLKSNAVSTEFRKVLARETARVDILELLKNDRSEKVRRKAEERLNNIK